MIKNISYKEETVIPCGKIIFRSIHSHHHYFQLLLPKSIYRNVTFPLKIDFLAFHHFYTHKNKQHLTELYHPSNYLVLYQ